MTVPTTSILLSGAAPAKRYEPCERGERNARHPGSGGLIMARARGSAYWCSSTCPVDSVSASRAIASVLRSLLSACLGLASSAALHTGLELGEYLEFCEMNPRRLDFLYRGWRSTSKGFDQLVARLCERFPRARGLRGLFRRVPRDQRRRPASASGSSRSAILSVPFRAPSRSAGLPHAGRAPRHDHLAIPCCAPSSRAVRQVTAWPRRVSRCRCTRR